MASHITSAGRSASHGNVIPVWVIKHKRKERERLKALVASTIIAQAIIAQAEQEASGQ